MTVTDTDSYITTYSYDLRNRLTSDSKETDAAITQNTYRYDNNGNQITDETDYYASQGSSSEPHAGFREDVAAITKREYNEFNQLVSAYIDGTYVQYTYRPDGLRHSKTVSGVTTYYIWDGSNIVAEYNQSNQVTARYIRGINLIFSEDGSGGNRKYYLYNAHGDVVQLADASGNIVWRYDYDAFGNEKPIAGQDPANDTNPFRYCGEYYDTETKTVYLRNRYYSPETGRFTSEDPIRDGLNFYTYCGGNPVTFYDPTGMLANISSINNGESSMYFYEPVTRLETRMTYLYGVHPSGFLAEKAINSIVAALFGERTPINMALISSAGLYVLQHLSTRRAFDINSTVFGFAGTSSDILGFVTKSARYNVLGYIMSTVEIATREWEINHNAYIDAIDMIIGDEFSIEMASYSQQEILQKYLFASQSLHALLDMGELTIETDPLGNYITGFRSTKPIYSLSNEHIYTISNGIREIEKKYN